MRSNGNSGRLAAAAAALLLAALVAVPVAADARSAAPEPAQNTVSVTGARRNPPTGLGAVVDLAIAAHSGPLGEDPAGTVSFAVMINRITHLEPFPLYFSGPVTCLDVTANVARLNFVDGYPITVEVVDEGGNGNDQFSFASGNSESDCSSLPDGVFEFNYDHTLGAGRVVVGDAAPATTLTHVPPPDSARRTVRFAFTSSEPGSFQCRLDGERFAPCESPQRYRSPAAGRHIFRVRAVDAGGSPDPSPARCEFRIRRRSP